MKKLAITLITIISLFSANISQGADRYVTILKADTDSTYSNIAVAANEVAEIVTLIRQGNAYGFQVYDQVKWTVTAGSITFGVLHWGRAHASGSRAPFPFVGPGTLSFKATGTVGGLITVKISPNPNINGVGQ